MLHRDFSSHIQIMDSCSAFSRVSLGAVHHRRRSSRAIPRCEFLPRPSSSSASPTLSNVESWNKTKGRPQSRSWFQSLCDLLEDAVDKRFHRNPLSKSVDPELLLVGNFAPVEELPPTACPVVKGVIPECLRGGAYIRNGPNPRQRPRGSHHIFDGDGMLHSLLLPADGSQPVLCSRYSRTSPPVISKLFGLRGLEGTARFFIAVLRIISGQMDRIEGMGPASTSVSYFWDNIFVLGETDRPFTVHLSPANGELQSKRSDLGRMLPNGMSVHYKQDFCTGELFAVSYGIVPPFLTFHCYDNGGNPKLKLPIWSVLRPSVFHDFAITKSYAIIPEVQLVMDPLQMVFGDGSFIACDPKKTPRVGVIRRDASSGSEIRWFDVPGFNPVHVCNAWEEGDDGGEVVVVGSCFVNMEHMTEKVELLHAFLEMVRIDLKTSTVVRTVLSALGLGFTAVNPNYMGKKTRYAYAAIATSPPKISGLAKLDLELAEKRVDCVVARREFGAGVFGGEPFFVPRGEGDEFEEDDGFLLMFIHDEEEEKSKFIVMEAKSAELEVVAEVELPRRVPYGIHGVFVSQSELNRQQR